VPERAGSRHVGPAVKFCGLTRPEDAEMGARLGADYLGVIFAGGPRVVTPARAREVLEPAGTASRVGVFGNQTPARIGAMAYEAGLDVVQLHGDPDAVFLAAVRVQFDGRIWAVVRSEGAVVPDGTEDLFEVADAVVIDAKVPGQLGGTGVAVAWGELHDVLLPWRRGAPLVLAGGLTPGNVAEAISILTPAVVDVSSGVEVAPGVKDHEKMRAFRRAAQGGDA
jgi:phosphoribosylanthranilate isomerase